LDGEEGVSDSQLHTLNGDDDCRSGFVLFVCVLWWGEVHLSGLVAFVVADVFAAKAEEILAGLMALVTVLGLASDGSLLFEVGCVASTSY